jgi:Protein of unknown function (DUF1822)
MFNASVFPTSPNLMPSETIWLEPEQFEQARTFISPCVSKASQWQLYLNALALFGFEQWLRKSTVMRSIDWSQCVNDIGAMYNLNVDDFKLTLIAKEHILDEITEIPSAAIVQPDRAAHFYVLLEVSEEQARIMIRGFLRYDQLRQALKQVNQPCLQNDSYQIPLSAFDPDPNHLLFYCEFLESTAIPLPAVAMAHQVTTETLQDTRLKLGQWLQGVFAEGWQTLDALNTLISPAAQLALNPRTHKIGANGGKLIDLGMQLQGQSTILLLNITEEPEEKMSVLAQLHPSGQDRFLPPQMTLALLSQSGEILQEVCSRAQDNYIQLKSFKGSSGTSFSIRVSFDDLCLCEHFEL